MKFWKSSNLGRLVLVLASGLLFQLILFHVAHISTERPLRGDEGTYLNKAAQIAAGTFPSPDFIWPPFYEYFLGGLYYLFGAHRLPLELIQIVLLVASGLFLRRLVLVAGLGSLAADAALTFLLLDPQIAAFAHYFWPENLHLFLGLLGAVLLCAGQPSKSRFFGAGVALGLAMLTKSLLGPFIPIFLIISMFREPMAALAERLKRTAGIAAGMALVVLPLLVFNGVRYGVWKIADSGPFNVWVGLNDPKDKRNPHTFVGPAFREFVRSSSDPRERNRIYWEKIADKVRANGWITILGRQFSKQYVRLFDKNSFFTDQLPGGLWAPRKARGSFATRFLRLWAYSIYALVLVLASFGLFQADRKELTGVAALPVLFLVYNMAIFLFLHTKTRFRIAFWPAVVFFAVLALSRFWSWKKSPELGKRRIGLRLAAGFALSALLLYLAFAPIG